MSYQIDMRVTLVYYCTPISNVLKSNPIKFFYIAVLKNFPAHYFSCKGNTGTTLLLEATASMISLVYIGIMSKPDFMPKKAGQQILTLF